MGKIDEIKLSIEPEDFAQRRTGKKGTSYYNGLAAGYREGYRKRASEGKESPDESDNCIKPDVSNNEVAVGCHTCKHNPHAPFIPEICEKCNPRNLSEWQPN